MPFWNIKIEKFSRLAREFISIFFISRVDAFFFSPSHSHPPARRKYSLTTSCSHYSECINIKAKQKHEQYGNTLEELLDYLVA